MSLETFWNFIGIKMYYTHSLGMFENSKQKKEIKRIERKDSSRFSIIVSSLDVIRDGCWNTKKIVSVTMVVCLKIRNRHVVPRCPQDVLET